MARKPAELSACFEETYVVTVAKILNRIALATALPAPVSPFSRPYKETVMAVAPWTRTFPLTAVRVRLPAKRNIAAYQLNQVSRGLTRIHM